MSLPVSRKASSLKGITDSWIREKIEHVRLQLQCIAKWKTSGKQDKEMEDKDTILERVTALFGREVSKLFDGKKYSESSANITAFDR